MPCFTTGTLIETAEGELPIEELRPGMLIETRDSGLQPLRWIGIRAMGGRALLDSPHLRPVFVNKGAFGNGLPTQDTMVSPNTRLPVARESGRFLVGMSEQMTAIKALVNHRGIQQIDSVGICYVHIRFDGHQVVAANGFWSECFNSSDQSMNPFGNSQRNEIFEIFPEIAASQARRDARKTAAKRISHTHIRSL